MSFASNSADSCLYEKPQVKRSVGALLNLAKGRGKSTSMCTGNSECGCVLCGMLFNKQSQGNAGEIKSNSDARDDDQMSSSSSSTIIMNYEEDVGTEPFMSDECKLKESVWVKLDIGKHEDGNIFRCTGNSNCKCLLCGWTDKQPYRCNVCNEQFGEMEDLKVHRMTHSYNFRDQHGGHERDERDKQSSEPSIPDATRSEPSHSDPTNLLLYNCEACRKPFKTERNLLNNHSFCTKKRILNKETGAISEEKETKFFCARCRPHVTGYECDICHLKFEMKRMFNHHVKLHNDQCPPKHMCHVCGKQYHSQYNLEVHIRIHTGERPFLCEICGRDFRDEYILKVHCKVSHSTKRPWKCHVCGKHYKTRKILKIHLQSLHAGTRHVCEICGKSYSRKSSLNDHKRCHTGQ